MMRSLFSGVSALKNHQVRMDVIGNNIANVNTIGFKSSRVTFRDILSQTLQAASSPQGGRGGTNPMQIGLGMALGAIETDHTQGSPEVTGRQTDMSIEGNGFFILSDGPRRFYTRAGLFGVDRDGTLISSVNGMKVMGWPAVNGVIDTNRDIGTLEIPMGKTISPIPTTTVKFGGNLDSRMKGLWELSKSEITVGGEKFSVEITEGADFGEWTLTITSQTDPAQTGSVTLSYEDDGSGNLVLKSDSQTLAVGTPGVSFDIEDVVGTPTTAGGLSIRETGTTGTPLSTATLQPPQVTQTVDVFDSLGNTHSVNFVFTKIDVGNDTSTWKWEAKGGGEETSGEVTFDAKGNLVSVSGAPLHFEPAGANPVEIMPDFAAVVQNASEGTLVFKSQDGYPQGTLIDYSVDESGIIIGEYSNGLTENLGQIATAVFSNPVGLLRAGDTTFVVSANSGEPEVGQPGRGANGKVTPGSLEMSNVDLSQQFTDMIITQRGFQANSRIITTSDEMLQELVNLKR